MKNLKKLASLLLALVMALALAIPAFADDETAGGNTTPTIPEGMTSITLPNTAGHTYNIYQIFTGDVAEMNGSKVLSNVKWGQNGTGTIGEEVSNTILDALEATVTGIDTRHDQEGNNDTAQLKEIEKYVNLTGTAYKANQTGTVPVDPGYYLVVDNGPFDKDKGETASLYMVEVAGPITVTEKAGNVTVDKKIVEGNDKVDNNNVAIGDTVNYEIVGTLPDNYATFETFYYVFSDTLSKGLTYTENSLKVYVVNGEGENATKTVIAADKYELTVNKTDADTAIEVKFEDLKTVEGVSATSNIVVEYSAVLNEDAVIGDAGNPNDVTLTYSRDPNHSGKGTPGENNPDHPTGETPKKEVRTYTTQLVITKVDEDGKQLPGAGFTLYGSTTDNTEVTEEVFVVDPNGTYYKLTDGTYTETEPTDATAADYESTEIKYSKTTQTGTETGEASEWQKIGELDAAGAIHTIKGLKAGTYKLVETTTPDGYNTMKDITFEIRYDVNGTPKFTVVNAKQDGKDLATDFFAANAEMLTAKIENNKGATLPSTGGIGTTIFYVVGGVMALGAVILLITKRRMSIDK